MLFAAISSTRAIFYGTAATVLPIFMLALGVQLRARPIFVGEIPRYFGPVGRAVALIAALLLAAASLVVMIVGEWLAISALYHDQDEHAGFVFIALIFGALIVFLGTSDAVLRQIREEGQKLGSTRDDIRRPRH